MSLYPCGKRDPKVPGQDLEKCSDEVVGGDCWCLFSTGEVPSEALRGVLGSPVRPAQGHPHTNGPEKHFLHEKLREPGHPEDKDRQRGVISPCKSLMVERAQLLLSGAGQECKSTSEKRWNYMAKKAKILSL